MELPFLWIHFERLYPRYSGRFSSHHRRYSSIESNDLQGASSSTGLYVRTNPYFMRSAKGRAICLRHCSRKASSASSSVCLIISSSSSSALRQERGCYQKPWRCCE